MPFSYAQYAGNGSTTTFSVPFPYLLKAHVKVYLGYSLLDETFSSELADGAGFSWTSDSQIQLVSAPTTGQTVTVIRQTPSSTLTVNWADGSNLIADDLRTADLQNLYVVQEQEDRSNLAIKTANDAAIDLNDLTTYGENYLGALASDPAAKPNGGVIQEGNLYYNTTTNRFRVYGETAWSDGAAPTTLFRWKKTAAGGETSLSGDDDNAQALAYTADLEQVYRNGALLVRGVDYVAINGTTITGLTALTAGDVMEVISFNAFTFGVAPTEVDFTGLPAANQPLDGSDLFLLRQGVTNKKVTADVFRTELATGAQAAQAGAEAAQAGAEAAQAGAEAAVQAGAAAAQANAEAAQASAEAAKAGAETARDDALLNASIYSTVASGLAATGVGDYFKTYSGNTNDFLDLYRVDAGPVAILVTTYPSRAFFSYFETDLGYSEYYLKAWLDSGSHLAMGITPAGVVHIEKGEIKSLAVDSITVDSITAPGGSIDLDSIDTPLISILNGGTQSGNPKFQELYSYVVLDSADRIACGVRPDGSVNFSKQFTINGQPLLNQISGDSTKGIDYDATTGVLSSPDGHANRIIVKWGDSISFDISNSTVLEQLESGRQMITRSTGGIDNGSILARFGALPITGRVYWEVKTVTVASYTGNTVTLSAGGTTDIEVGDYFYGSGQHNDTVITAVDTGTDEITLSIDAGTLVTTADAYAIQRPKIEAGKQTRIHNLLPTTVHDQTSTGVLSHFHIKNLKGVPYPGGTNLPRDFNRENNSTSSDWADVIAEHTADGFISTAPRVVVDTNVTSGGTAAGATSIVVADASRIAPGHFIMAKGIPYGCRVWDVDYDTNTVKLAMDTDGAVTGNVRVYERVEFKPDTTADISGIGEVQLKHCINIFDFDDGTIPEISRPHWWPNQHHGPEQFDFSRADHVAQCRAFVDTQNNPYGKYLITSYQIWGGIYEGSSSWDDRRDRALWASEAFPENFYDLAREVWVKAESWYQTNYLTLYQANWEKTFIKMESGAIAGAPTSGTYSGGAELMDGDLWSDGGSLYVLLLTTGDATHDAAQEAMFGGTHTLPTTTGQGIWITLSSYQTLAGTGTLSSSSSWAFGRSGVVDGVTYKGSAYDIARKSSPRIGKRDSAHSNAYGSRLLGYLIGQELLRRGW